MENLDIRAHAMRRGVKFWQIAEELGLSDSAFSKKLRHELDESEKNRVIAVVERLANQGGC